jgi:GNAT superfamily N-acetyltransferase
VARPPGAELAVNHGAPDEYILRRATGDDLGVIGRHRRRMFEDMGHSDLAALDAMERATRPFLADGLRDGSYQGFLLESGGRVVAGGGVALLPFQPQPRDPGSRRAFIINMFTEPEHRRQGLARRLMEAMLAWCRDEGLATVSLHASEEGRPLYASLGFEPTNEMRLTLRRAATAP